MPVAQAPEVDGRILRTVDEFALELGLNNAITFPPESFRTRTTTLRGSSKSCPTREVASLEYEVSQEVSAFPVVE